MLQNWFFILYSSYSDSESELIPSSPILSHTELWWFSQSSPHLQRMVQLNLFLKHEQINVEQVFLQLHFICPAISGGQTWANPCIGTNCVPLSSHPNLGGGKSFPIHSWTCVFKRNQILETYQMNLIWF